MSKFQPKEALREAREAEKVGKKGLASAKYAQVGIRLRRAGKLDDAKSLLGRAIRLSPESPRLYLQMALCDSAIGDEHSARDHMDLFSRYALQKKEKTAEYREYLELELKDKPELRQVFYDYKLKLDRTDGGPFIARAKALMEQSEKEAALKALLDALRTKTHDNEAIELLREVFKWRNDREGLDFLASFESGKLTRRDFLDLVAPRKEKEKQEERRAEPLPEEETMTDLIAQLEASLGIQIDEPHDSVKPLIKEFRRRSQAILGGDSKARIDMGLAYFEMGLVEEACGELKMVTPTDKRYPEALCLMGEILYSTGSDLGALEVFQNCLRTDQASDDVKNEARYKLVQIYTRLGDWQQAVDHARALEKICPGYREVHGLKIHAEECLENRQGGGERKRRES